MRRGRHPIVERAIALGVTDERVLEPVRQPPRVAFVPPAARMVADRDAPIPIGHGQTTSQPSLIAHVVAELELRPTDRVLEVGTGLGYQTALLAQFENLVKEYQFKVISASQDIPFVFEDLKEGISEVLAESEPASVQAVAVPGRQDPAASGNQPGADNNGSGI